MKREGRQHGLVRTFGVQPDPLSRRPDSRPHKLASPPTAGSFSKVSSKPTNHSKPTGKYISDPVSKPRDKIKGTHKLRSGDIVLNHRLLNWRVVDSRPANNSSGASANYLLNDNDDDDDEIRSN